MSTTPAPDDAGPPAAPLAAVDRVFFVHGYSSREFKVYGAFPALLAARGIPSASILLSAFLSLDDQVTCDDLAAALEDHVATQLEAHGASIARTAFVCHSTGALVVRRWILNRLGRGQPLPSHLITYAGAHHGSTLAQVGRTIISRLFRGVVDQSSVGQQILNDLDYGSAFLWQLNDEWLDEWNRGSLNGLRCFSLGGDDHVSGFPGEVFWQVGEQGSDGVVRVSAANLNYARLEADPEATPPTLRVVRPVRPTAHLIIPGYAHHSILGGVKAATDAPFAALAQALAVGNDTAYQAVLADWTARTQAWTAQHPADANATIVIRLRDEGGRAIDDSLILIEDQSGSAHNVSGSVEPHQPIQNNLSPSSVSFYVNYGRFTTTRPHIVHIEARSGSQWIDYRELDYQVADPVAVLVQPNEFTYADIRLPRDVSRTYAVAAYDPSLNINAVWPPLPG